MEEIEYRGENLQVLAPVLAPALEVEGGVLMRLKLSPGSF